MNEKGTHIFDFMAELRRRKVTRVAIVYGVVGFAVIEAADIIVGALNLPPQFVTFVVVGTLLGYPIALVLAWSYEIVPDAAIRQAAEVQQTDVKKGPEANSRRTRLRIVLPVAGIVLALVAWVQLSSTEAPPVQTEPHFTAIVYSDSIAVLPLDNLTGSAAYDVVAKGITEEITAHLTQIASLKVISRTSVEAIDKQNLTIPQMAQALGVRHVIEGSLQMSGGDLRVKLQHINAETDGHLWADDFEAGFEDSIKAQEAIARQATLKVVSTLGMDIPDVRTQHSTSPAQEAYLLGLHWLSRRTHEGLNRAINNFREAARLDPDYAAAYASLASTYALALSYRYDVYMDGYTQAAQSLAYAERAIELNNDLATGYAARGYLRALVDSAARPIASDFERAADLQPNAPSIPSWRARSLAMLGQTEEAYSEAKRAVELDPLASGRHVAVAELSLYLRKYDSAIAAARSAIALEPGLARARAIEARALLLSGRAEECLDVDLGPHRVVRATCLDSLGRTTEAAELIDKVISDLREGKAVPNGFTAVIPFEDLAVHYAMRGDAAASLDWAVKAYQISPVGLEIRVLGSELFDGVRDDDDFASTIASIRAGLYDRVRRESVQIDR